MKKIISLYLLGAAYLPFADASAATTYSYGATETETASPEVADRDIAATKDTLSGWFIGLGIAQGGYKTTAEETGHWYRWNKRIDLIGGDYTGGDVNATFYNITEGARVINFQRDGNFLNSATFFREGNSPIQNKLNKLGASLVCGWSDFDGNLYYGVQLAFDISGNKNLEESKGEFRTVRLESKGFRPYFEVMFGRYFETIDALLYLKGGVTYSRAKLLSDYGDIKLGSFAPLVGFGAKKVVADNMTVCTEVGYVFETNKKGSLNAAENGLVNYDEGTGLADHQETILHELEGKVRNRGYNIRVFATYNF